MLIFTHAVPKELKVAIGPKLLQQFPKGSPQREIGLELLKSGVLQLEDGATQLLKLIRLPNTTNVSFTVPRVCISSRCNTTLPRNQTCTNEPCRQSNLCPHREKTNPKEIIADVLREFLLLENAALTGSEQVFVFGVAGKSYAYNHIANAVRETWGNDDSLRSHDIAWSQQLQGGHLAYVHWTGEEDDWQETDHDYEDSLEPWASEWYNTDGYGDESHLEETDWTEDFYETDDYDPNDSTFSDHYPALLEQSVETQEGAKLETA